MRVARRIFRSPPVSRVLRPTAMEKNISLFGPLAGSESGKKKKTGFNLSLLWWLLQVFPGQPHVKYKAAAEVHESLNRRRAERNQRARPAAAQN